MSSDNPYAPPQIEAEQNFLSPTSTVVLATKGQRFCNYFIDRIICRTLGSGMGFILGNAMAVNENSSKMALKTVGIVMGLIITLAYYILMEGMCGKTIGKMITGTKVVSVSGKPASFGQIIGRSFCRLIPFEPFSFCGSEAIGWHDSISDTCVIKSR